MYLKKRLLNIVLAALMFAGMATHEAQAETLFGRCVGVSDGDTLTVLDKDNKQFIIRLFAIDAPETSCHAKINSAQDDGCVDRGQPFGKASKKSLSEIAFGQMVNVEIQPGESYGRLIGTVWVSNVNANLEQVRRGYAWMYKKYAQKGLFPEEYKEMEEAESHARDSNLGLWSEGKAIPPWNYRHNGGGYHGQ